MQDFSVLDKELKTLYTSQHNNEEIGYITGTYSWFKLGLLKTIPEDAIIEIATNRPSLFKDAKPFCLKSTPADKPICAKYVKADKIGKSFKEKYVIYRQILDVVRDIDKIIDCTREEIFSILASKISHLESNILKTYSDGYSKQVQKDLLYLIDKDEADFRKKYSDIFAQMLNEQFFAPSTAKYIIHVGKTGSGKTYQAIERLKKSGSGCYLSPLRLLAIENYDKLIDAGLDCSLITGEEQIESPTATIFCSTIEMMNYHKKYDCVVIDEAMMISDKDRGKSWTKAIFKTQAEVIHIIINNESIDLIEKLLKLTNRNYEIKKYERLQDFKFSEHPIIIDKNILPKGIFVTFSRIGVLTWKAKLEKIGIKTSALYGALPPEVKRSELERFESGSTKIMVSTDCIGQGINCPCDYIVFLDTEKFDGENNRRLLPVEVRQIAGRCGRYGKSSENSFVTATNMSDLKFIKKTYNTDFSTEKGVIGFDFEMFSLFPEKMSSTEKILYFKKIDFIPDSIQKFILKENIDKYLRVSDFVDKPSFDINTRWAFITAPLKDDNEMYLRNLIKTYEVKQCLKTPSLVNINMMDSRSIESAVSCIELFCNLCRSLLHVETDYENMLIEKEKFVEQIIKILVDKKLSSKKKCKLCDDMIDFLHPYAYCDECYETKVKTGYSDYGWDED